MLFIACETSVPLHTRAKPFAYAVLLAAHLGTPTLDEVGLCKGQKFTLHYDFGDDWMFTITVSKIVEVQKDFSPRIVKAKGSIQQYPDWNEDEFDYE